MATRLLALLAVIACVAIPAGTSDATILIKKDLASLSAEAPLIVIAKVGKQSASYAEGTKVIFTHTDLEIEETIKGKHQKKLVVSEVGGRMGDIVCKVEGMPRFRSGERVLLALKKDALGQWRTHGCIQGRFSVAYNEALETDLVDLSKSMSYVYRPYFADLSIARPMVTLSEFREKVSELVKAEAKRRKDKEEGK